MNLSQIDWSCWDWRPAVRRALIVAVLETLWEIAVSPITAEHLVKTAAKGLVMGALWDTSSFAKDQTAPAKKAEEKP